MPTLHYTVGLPASGKTTAAREMVARNPGMLRSNRDDLRASLHDGKFSKGNEKLVTRMQHAMIVAALVDGRDVVCDDTNLAPRTVAKLRALADDAGAGFERIDFTGVSLAECIRRDPLRDRSVGEDVIRNMWERYLAPPPRERNGLPQCVIVDVDGTLAHMSSGRSPFDWGRVGEDTPDLMVAELARRFHHDHIIVVLTGRDGCCYETTEAWLIEHGIPFDELWSRAAGDTRKDSIVKRELFDAHVEGRYDPVLVVDDRQQVVDMWRGDLGLTVWQVAAGRF